MTVKVHVGAFNCISSPFSPFRTHCQKWWVSCRLALLTLWSVCAPTQAVSPNVLTAPMCPPSCSTSGCLRWCAWSVMDTLSASPSQDSSAGLYQSMLPNDKKSSSEVIVLFLNWKGFTMDSSDLSNWRLDRLHSRQVNVISVSLYMTGRTGQSLSKDECFVYSLLPQAWTIGWMY